MNKEERINKLIEEALNSVDDIRRAEPKPFLLTRINARMNRVVESVWEKAGWFIARPVVAFTGLQQRFDSFFTPMPREDTRLLGRMKANIALTLQPELTYCEAVHLSTVHAPLPHSEGWLHRDAVSKWMRTSPRPSRAT